MTKNTRQTDSEQAEASVKCAICGGSHETPGGLGGEKNTSRLSDLFKSLLEDSPESDPSDSGMPSLESVLGLGSMLNMLSRTRVSTQISLENGDQPVPVTAIISEGRRRNFVATEPDGQYILRVENTSERYPLIAVVSVDGNCYSSGMNASRRGWGQLIMPDTLLELSLPLGQEGVIGVVTYVVGDEDSSSDQRNPLEHLFRRAGKKQEGRKDLIKANVSTGDRRRTDVLVLDQDFDPSSQVIYYRIQDADSEEPEEEFYSKHRAFPADDRTLMRKPRTQAPVESPESASEESAEIATPTATATATV